jgi:hypothetical protein
MVPAYGAGTTLEMGDLRCVIARAARLIGILKIFVSKYQNQEIGENRQGSYATLHIPEHIAHVYEVITSQVRQRFPSRSLKPLPTHPRLRPNSRADESEKAGRSQRSAFIFSGSIDWRDHSKQE